MFIPALKLRAEYILNMHISFDHLNAISQHGLSSVWMTLETKISTCRKVFTEATCLFDADAPITVLRTELEWAICFNLFSILTVDCEVIPVFCKSTAQCANDWTSWVPLLYLGLALGSCWNSISYASLHVAINWLFTWPVDNPLIVASKVTICCFKLSILLRRQFTSRRLVLIEVIVIQVTLQTCHSD